MKKIYSLILVCLVLVTLGTSCSSDDNSTITRENMRVQIEPYTTMKVVPPFKGPEVEHLVVIKISDKTIDYTPGIEGFKYEKGYTYVLEVTKVFDKSLMDSNGWYELVKVISKESK